MKLIEEGRLDQKVMSIILTNTRTPDIHENDVTSQIASVQAAAGDVLGLFEKYGVDSMLACFSELIDYSDKRTRDEIRSIPDGTYTHEEPVLDDGACGGPYKLKPKNVKTGSAICFALPGPDPPNQRPINSPPAHKKTETSQ